MALSLYDASIPVYLQMLGNLSAMLDKAEAHARDNGVDLATYAEARLAPDMHPFNRQIHLASDSAKSGAARLSGVAPPSFPDVETTFPELKERIAKTVAFVSSVTRKQLEGAEDRTVELPLPNRTLTFTGANFLFQFAMPNFLFHIVTAYDILRAQGVPLGKMDYLAGANPPA